MQEQAVKTYKDQKAFSKDVNKMLQQGWMIQSQNSYQPNAGLGRIAMLGLWSAVFKQKAQIIVTYTRTPQNVPPPLSAGKPGYAADGRRLTLKEAMQQAKENQRNR